MGSRYARANKLGSLKHKQLMTSGRDVLSISIKANGSLKELGIFCLSCLFWFKHCWVFPKSQRSQRGPHLLMTCSYSNPKRKHQ